MPVKSKPYRGSMGSLGHTLQVDLLPDWAKLALNQGVCVGGVSRC